MEQFEQACGIRGCTGKHTGVPVVSSGYHILRCDAKPAAHRAWNCKGAWVWSTRKPADALKESAQQSPAALQSPSTPTRHTSVAKPVPNRPG